MIFKCFLFLIYLYFANAFPSDEFTHRVVGGEPASIGEAPFQIIMKSNGSFVCSGSIISKRTILTAAHCVPSSSKMTVVAGTNFLSSGGINYAVAKSIVHENFGYPTAPSNDIALLILEEDIEFNDLIQPISLNEFDYEESADVTLFGWGKTGIISPPAEELQKLVLKTIPNDICQLTWGNQVTYSMMCTFTRIAQGACNGDSGGPLVSKTGKVVGIVSWGGFCASGRPDVYTRVSYFIEWIKQHMV